jgi:hypothetical protein
MYYKLEIVRNSSTLTTIVKVEDDNNYWIPTDESNSDYQTYLAWVEEGNEPEVFDPEEYNNG